MGKETCIERKNEMKKYIRHEGEKEQKGKHVRHGKGIMYRK